MPLDISTGQYVNMAGGVIISLLGLFVVAKTRGARDTHLFGWFLVVMGPLFVVANLEDSAIGTPSEEPLKWASVGVTLVAATLLACAAPRMTPALSRRQVALAWLTVAPVAVAMAMIIVIDSADLATDAELVGVCAWLSSLVVALVLWARQHRAEATTAGSSRRWAALSVGLGLYTFIQVGEWVMRGGEADLGPPFALSLTVVVGIWLSNTQAPSGRTARNVALLLLVVFLVGMLVELKGVATQSGINGITRVLGVGIIVHAILRDRLLGIDAKVRFAISKSTIAAIFIAVFFVASEVAQQFFSERTSSTYIGIGIAGTLVFAMAPIQRAAEKLAAKAVPVDASRAGGILDSQAPLLGTRSALRVYERAMRAAAGDGSLTRDEEEHLAHIAHELGISPLDALRVRRAVEEGR